MSQTDSAETYNQETAMSEPVDIVAEMRGFADALESVAPLVETPANLRRWADHMERLEARMKELEAREFVAKQLIDELSDELPGDEGLTDFGISRLSALVDRAIIYLTHKQETRYEQ